MKKLLLIPLLFVSSYTNALSGDNLLTAIPVWNGFGYTNWVLAQTWTRFASTDYGNGVRSVAAALDYHRPDLTYIIMPLKVVEIPGPGVSGFATTFVFERCPVAGTYSGVHRHGYQTVTSLDFWTTNTSKYIN